jgi:hypothetical protein
MPRSSRIKAFGSLAWVNAHQDEIRPAPSKTNSEPGGCVPGPKGRRGRILFVDRHNAVKNAHPPASAEAAAIVDVSAAPAECP